VKEKKEAHYNQLTGMHHQMHFCEKIKIKKFTLYEGYLRNVYLKLSDGGLLAYYRYMLTLTLTPEEWNDLQQFYCKMSREERLSMDIKEYHVPISKLSTF
jgi:hypothetical protein